MESLTRNSDVVLINPSCDDILDDHLEPPMGLLYIQSFLISKGFTCTLHDMAIKGDVATIPRSKIYGIGAYTNNFYRSVEIAKYLKARDDSCITVVGGHHVTALPEDGINNFDVTVVGEGELPMLSIAEQVRDSVKNCHTDRLPPLDNLIIYDSNNHDIDELPPPDYSSIDISSYTRAHDGNKVISVLCSRGCKNNCRFCNSIVKKRHGVRSRSVDSIIAEVKSLKDNFGIEYVKFNDDNFLDCVNDPEKLLWSMKYLNVKYRCMVRSDALTEENAKLLVDTGCYYVSIGVESMCNRMLRLMNKGITADDNINAIRNANKVGLNLRVFLLVGFPGETDDSVDHTIWVMKKLEYNSFGVYSFVPYPGTDVWNNPEKYGAVIDKDYSKFVTIDSEQHGSCVMTTSEFNCEDVNRWHKKVKESLSEHMWSYN